MTNPFHPGHWFVAGTQRKEMVIRSAREYASRTSHPQTVHLHEQGEECDHTCIKITDTKK